MSRQTITICSSANFYEEVVRIQAELEAEGFRVLIPYNAVQMQKAGDYTVRKTWYENEKDYPKKTRLIMKHFAEVEKSDAILVVNNKKHDIDNYVGGNVLMEMSLAMYLRRPIFLLNDFPTESPFIEEIMGLQPIALHGKLENLKLELRKHDKSL